MWVLVQFVHIVVILYDMSKNVDASVGNRVDVMWRNLASSWNQCSLYIVFGLHTKGREIMNVES
jgi:hypothetical protein